MCFFLSGNLPLENVGIFRPNHNVSFSVYLLACFLHFLFPLFLPILPILSTLSIPFHSIPFHSIPFHSIPFHSIPFHSIPFHSIPFHSIPFLDKNKICSTMQH